MAMLKLTAAISSWSNKFWYISYLVYCLHCSPPTYQRNLLSKPCGANSRCGAFKKSCVSKMSPRAQPSVIGKEKYMPLPWLNIYYFDWTIPLQTLLLFCDYYNWSNILYVHFCRNTCAINICLLSRESNLMPIYFNVRSKIYQLSLRPYSLQFTSLKLWYTYDIHF